MCRHLHARASRRADPHLVLGKERGDDDDLVARLGDGRDGDGQACGGTCREVHLLGLGGHVVATANMVGHGLAHARIARCRRVAVQGARLLVHELEHRLLHGIGRRHARVADAEVEHVLGADFRLAHHAVREQLANRARLGSQAVHSLVHHMHHVLVLSPGSAVDFDEEQSSTTARARGSPAGKRQLMTIW